MDKLLKAMRKARQMESWEDFVEDIAIEVAKKILLLLGKEKPLVYTIPEVADLLRIGPETVRRLVKRGTLTAARTSEDKGRTLLYTQKDLDACLKKLGSLGLEE